MPFRFGCAVSMAATPPLATLPSAIAMKPQRSAVVVRPLFEVAHCAGAAILSVHYLARQPVTDALHLEIHEYQSKGDQMLEGIHD